MQKQQRVIIKYLMRRTFDELWEMACGKQIGFVKIPVVCVNVDGYYDSFKEMLARAHEDNFLYKLPTDILHFEDTSEKAIEYIEEVLTFSQDAIETNSMKSILERKPSLLERMMSAYDNFPSFDYTADEYDDDRAFSRLVNLIPYAVTFVAGMAMGAKLQMQNVR